MGDLSPPVVVLRVTVRAPDLDAFITRYSRHIAGDRIFIFSKAPQPVGTQVRFNLQLQTGEVLIQGKGTVKRVQKDDGDARHPPGMEVQFTPLDERSATLVDFMMATRAGLTEPVAASKAPPLVRAVIPKKPVASVLPKLPKSDTPPPLPPVPSGATPSAPLPLVPSAPLPPVSTTMGALPTPKTKPTPVARPPSLSLESVWKSEASEEKTFADLQRKDLAAPPADSGSPPLVLPDSAPLAVVAAAHNAAHNANAAAAAANHMGDSVPTEVGAPPVDVAATPLSPGLASLAGDAVAPSVEPLPATKSQPLPTIIPTTVDPSVNATPVFAESWGGDAPANPFSDVSDGAIEYFVEWSLEQSIGPRALPQAQFSDVPMALPGQSDGFDVLNPPTSRQRLIQLGAVFAAGLFVGGLVVGLLKHAPPPPPPVVAAVEPAPPVTGPADKPAAADDDGELAITTHPPGASVTIDGTAAGTTPLSKRVAPGKHEIVVTKERYSAITTSTDAPGKLALDLRRPTATLHVASNPPAADVVIGGEHRGKTPIDVKLPGFESYDVRIVHPGAKPWRKNIYLSHAQNRVDATLATTPRAGRR